MPLNLSMEWRNCIAQGRQREGLTKQRIAEKMSHSNAELTTWHKVGSHSFIKALATYFKYSIEEAIYAYIIAACSQLPANHKQFMVAALNLDGRKGNLGDRQREMTKLLNIKSQATYRATLEDPSLIALTKILDNPTDSILIEMGVDEIQLEYLLPRTQNLNKTDSGRVVVVGAAVMDLNFVVTHMPNPGESVQALRFASNPGGKGLCQAVACARLGLSTELISVIGDDTHGIQILEYLEKQNVATRLIVTRERVQSSVTGVFTLSRTGASSAIGWKNDRSLLIGSDLLDEDRFLQSISECDFLLTSFELPEPLVSKAIRLAHENGATTIVTPAPPFYDVLIDPQVRSQIDFVVANIWELQSIASPDRETRIPDDEWITKIARELMIADQIKNVVVTHANDCHAFLGIQDESNAGFKRIVFTSSGAISESAGERDAFCAMLAHRLHGSKRELADIIDAINWATAAMACVKAGISVPETMPSLKRVEELIRHQGTITPRLEEI